MEIFLIICGTLLTATLIVTSVYLIQTLMQVRQTARAVQVLAENVNQEMVKLRSATDTVSSLASQLTGVYGKVASVGFSLLGGLAKGLFKRFTHRNEGYDRSDN
ncbi:MAG TPA: hypothetical protein PK876_03480 [Elusimicrobiota bacterium]|nr:hypothetical protein [Elusimicrobiota bacterium]